MIGRVLHTATMAVALCLGAPAMAGTLGVHIGSHHFPSKDFNNVNPGLYYVADNGATVGTYYNSERKQSVYAGYTTEFGWLRVQVGVITGYQGRVLPLVAPSVGLGHGFRLTALPKVERSGASVIHLSWETAL